MYKRLFEGREARTDDQTSGGREGGEGGLTAILGKSGGGGPLYFKPYNTDNFCIPPFVIFQSFFYSEMPEKWIQYT